MNWIALLSNLMDSIVGCGILLNNTNNTYVAGDAREADPARVIVAGGRRIWRSPEFASLFVCLPPIDSSGGLSANFGRVP